MAYSEDISNITIRTAGSGVGLFTDRDSWNFTLMSNTQADSMKVSRTIRWICTATPLSIIGLVVNIIAILSIKFISGPLNSVHVLMVHLAISDILGAMICLLVAVLEVTQHITTDLYSICFHNIITLMHIFIYTLCTLTLLAVTVFRFITIRFPMAACKCLEVPKGLMAIAAIWFFSLAICMPGVVALWNSERDCFLKGWTLLTMKYLHQIWRGLIILIILVIVGIYAWVYKQARRCRIRINNLQVGKKIEESYKALKTTMILTCTLIIAIIPTFIYFLVAHYINVPNDFPRDILENLPLLNFISDPVIYGFRTKDVRNGFKKLIRYCCRCNQTGERQRGRAFSMTHSTMYSKAPMWVPTTTKSDQSKDGSTPRPSLGTDEEEIRC